MIIYKVTNRLTGKLYIGQTVQPLKERWRDHVRGDKQPEGYLHRAIVKYGAENFTIEEIDSSTTVEGLNLLEEHYIKKFNSLAPNGYNLLPGGENRRCHEDTKVKISETMKQKPKAELFGGRRWDKGHSGPLTEETRAKISDTMKQKPKAALFGGKRMNGAPKGRPVSAERRKQISETLKGRPATQNYKPVVVVETGVEYPSVNAAAKALGINRVTVSGLLRSGKASRHGLHFQFVLKR